MQSTVNRNSSVVAMHVAQPTMPIKTKKALKRKREIKLKISLRKSIDGGLDQDRGQLLFILKKIYENQLPRY